MNCNQVKSLLMQLIESLSYCGRHAKDYNAFIDLLQGELQYLETCKGDYQPLKPKNKVLHVTINGANYINEIDEYVNVEFKGKSFVVPKSCCTEEE